MREKTISTVEVSSLDGSAEFSILGNFRINNHYYLIINLENSPKIVTKSTSTSFRSPALASETARFEVDGQLLAIIEVENSLNANSEIVALLTDRELQIATLVALGNCNKQIASHLGISEWTISTHLRRIFAKLGVDSRAAMIYRCVPLLLSIGPLPELKWRC